MATFGTVNGNHVIVTGAHYAALRIEWQLASQNVGGNFSTINWQAYIDFFGCDAQLDNGHVNWNSGALYNNGGRVYNYAGNFTNHTVTMGTGSFNIGADGVGNTTLLLNGSIDVYASGTSSGSGSWTLPQIPRYPNITSFTINTITDSLIEFGWSADRLCDYMSWWSVALDGGGHHDTPTSATSWIIDLNNLISAHTYDITVAVRSAASGLWTTSGTLNPTTNPQNNFIRRRVM